MSSRTGCCKGGCTFLEQNWKDEVVAAGQFHKTHLANVTASAYRVTDDNSTFKPRGEGCMRVDLTVDYDISPGGVNLSDSKGVAYHKAFTGWGQIFPNWELYPADLIGKELWMSIDAKSVVNSGIVHHARIYPDQWFFDENYYSGLYTYGSTFGSPVAKDYPADTSPSVWTRTSYTEPDHDNITTYLYTKLSGVRKEYRRALVSGAWDGIPQFTFETDWDQGMTSVTTKRNLVKESWDTLWGQWNHDNSTFALPLRVVPALQQGDHTFVLAKASATFLTSTGSGGDPQVNSAWNRFSFQNILANPTSRWTAIETWNSQPNRGTDHGYYETKYFPVSPNEGIPRFISGEVDNIALPYVTARDPFFAENSSIHPDFSANGEPIYLGWAAFVGTNQLVMAKPQSMNFSGGSGSAAYLGTYEGDLYHPNATEGVSKWSTLYGASAGEFVYEGDSQTDIARPHDLWGYNDAGYPPSLLGSSKTEYPFWDDPTTHYLDLRTGSSTHSLVVDNLCFKVF